MLSRTAIIDASSAIILCKSGLHSLLTGIYNIVLPESVFKEITVNQYIGSQEYMILAEEGKIQVRQCRSHGERQDKTGLSAGEYDTIELFYSGHGDFIIIDDGPAAKYCKKVDIPFINALLFPVVLRLIGIKDNDFCLRAMQQVIEKGRYSQHVLNFARNCTKENIAFAIPEARFS